MNHQNNGTSKPDKTWQTCEPGIISECSKQPATYSRRDALIKAGGAAGLVVGAVVLRNQLMNNVERIPEVPYAISCEDVQSKLPAFITAELPPDMMMNMNTHLEHCTTCQVVYHDLGGIKNLRGEKNSGNENSDQA